MTRMNASTVARAAQTAPGAALDSPGHQAFWNLERWLGSNKAAGQGLHRIEVEEERRGREMLRLLLQSHLDSRGPGDVGPVLRVPTSAPSATALTYTHKRLHTRRLVTVFGTVQVTRMGYGRCGHASRHPLDAQLQLPVRAYSYEIQRRLVKAAVLMPFDEALETVTDATGVTVPKRSAEQLIIDASTDFETFYARRTESALTQQGPILVASIDGKGIPMVKTSPTPKKVRMGRGEKRQKKRMATVAAVFTQEPDVRTPAEVIASLFAASDDTRLCAQRRRARHPLGKRVWASLLSGKPAFIEDVKSEMMRRDPQQQKKWVVVTDGERGLQRQVCEVLTDVTFILDLLHVMEKLWTVSYEVNAEGSPQAEAFVRDRLSRILRGEVSQVVKGLRQIATKRHLTGRKRKTFLNVAAYYYRNRHRMCYDHYLARGFPIASGSVEGACKNLIKDRMERSGMRWTPTMAESMLRLRATYLSGDFEQYWDYHVDQEQQRLYPKEQWQPVPARVVLK